MHVHVQLISTTVIFREVGSTLNKSLTELRKAQLLLEENLDETDNEALLQLFKVHSNKGETNKVLGEYNESQ